MAYKVNSLEEMPNALSYLIESVEALQSKVNAERKSKVDDNTAKMQSIKWLGV